MKKKILLAVAILVITAGSFFGGVWASSRTEAPAQILEGMNIDLRPKPLDATEIENLVNQERIKAGLQPLEHSEKLKASACAKLDHMVENNYWAHTSPDGVEPWHWFSLVGYGYVRAGENLAYEQKEESILVEGWMRSPTHKENIVGSFTEHGLCTRAVEYQGGKHNVTVHHFGIPL